MKCKSLRESVRVVVLLDDLHAHTHALTLERMQADANRRAPIKTRLRTLMSFWTKFQLSIFASIINDVIKTSSKKEVTWPHYLAAFTQDHTQTLLG